jgi:hypothetical protein
MNKDFVMNKILNIENENVSPNISPNRGLNRPDAENPFFDISNRRILYYLDYLLKNRITTLTGARKKIYKGMHVLCNDERKTCKFKILDNEIEARGDCFFQSALYNLGKEYFGPRGNNEEEEHNMQNAINFRQLLVRHYLEYNPPNKSIIEAMEPFQYTDVEVIKSYAHLFNRNVCVFTVLKGTTELSNELTVDLLINKNALSEKIDFFILTQGPAHYTTLKRIPKFKQAFLMNLLLDYDFKIDERLSREELKKYGTRTNITIRNDLNIEDSIDLPHGTFGDTIRHYEIGNTKDVYRLFKVDVPKLPALEHLPEVEGSPNLSPKTLSGLSEEQQVNYILKKTSKGSDTRSSRSKASKVDAPLGTVLGVTRYTNPLEPIGPPLAPLIPLSYFEHNTSGIGKDMINRSTIRNRGPIQNRSPYNANFKKARASKYLKQAENMSPYTAAQLKNHFDYSPTLNPEAHAKKMFAKARNMSPYTAAQLKNHFGYSPESKGSLKPRPKVSKPKPRKPKSESISNANIAQLLSKSNKKEVEAIIGNTLNGLPRKSESKVLLKPRQKSSKISNSSIAQLLSTSNKKEVEEIIGNTLTGLPEKTPAPRNPKRFSANLPPKPRQRASKKKVPLKPESAAPVFANSPKFSRRARSRSPPVARNLNRTPGSGVFTSMFSRIFSKKKK